MSRQIQIICPSCQRPLESPAVAVADPFLVMILILMSQYQRAANELDHQRAAHASLQTALDNLAPRSADRESAEREIDRLRLALEKQIWHFDDTASRHAEDRIRWEDQLQTLAEDSRIRLLEERERFETAHQEAFNRYHDLERIIERLTGEVRILQQRNTAKFD